ncbi:hypothetical protein D3C87_1940320 [compost metagenome]
MAETPLDGGVGQAGMENMRQYIDRDHQRRGMENLRVEKQIGQGCGQEHQPGQAVEKVHHGVEVADALPQVQTFAK